MISVKLCCCFFLQKFDSSFGSMMSLSFLITGFMLIVQPAFKIVSYYEGTILISSPSYLAKYFFSLFQHIRNKEYPNPDLFDVNSHRPDGKYPSWHRRRQAFRLRQQHGRHDLLLGESPGAGNVSAPLALFSLHCHRRVPVGSVNFSFAHKVQFNIYHTNVSSFLKCPNRRFGFRGVLGTPEFDVGRNTMFLIYAQTVTWLGFYYSPLLPAIFSVILVFTFYIRRVKE